MAPPGFSSHDTDARVNDRFVISNVCRDSAPLGAFVSWQVNDKQVKLKKDLSKFVFLTEFCPINVAVERRRARHWQWDGHGSAWCLGSFVFGFVLMLAAMSGPRKKTHC